MDITLFISQNNYEFSQNARYEMLQILPSKIRERALRFRFWKDTQALMLRKLLTFLALKMYGLNEDILLGIKEDEFGRPFHSGFRGDFNISHSEEYVVCAVVGEGRVGIDIEIFRNIDLYDFQMALTSEEITNIEQSSNLGVEFFNAWTTKEAVIKADGRGLSLPLQDVVLHGTTASVLGTRWHVRRIYIDPKYCAHLATNRTISQVEIIPITISFDARRGVCLNMDGERCVFV